MNRMNTEQKRITGKNPDLYKWADRKPSSARSHQRYQTYESRSRAEESNRIVSRALMYVTFVFMVFVLFVAIGMHAKNAKIQKNIDALEKEKKTLGQQLQNRQDEYDLESRDVIVIQNGREVLGMVMADSGNSYVLPGFQTDTYHEAQTVEARESGR